jgi:glycosyltransferase involved in cell wall biosynthesis
MPTERDHISVCVCTYKRPELLARLLGKLAGQRTEGRFSFSIVVVDNDEHKSARATVEEFLVRHDVSLDYYVEKERSYSRARNKAVHSAKGSLLAFVDDDEYPEESWLLNLYKTLKTYGADGVLGPVHPSFESEPPDWVLKGRFCERESFPTGTRLRNSKYTRTGNVLFEMSLLQGQEPFDPRFGETGGEDTDFFDRMIDRGKQFIWCNEAPVWESVPPERMKRLYFLRRALWRGIGRSRNVSILSVMAIKSLSAVFLYTAALPVCLVIGQHALMKCMIRSCDHWGKLIGLMGLAPDSRRAI